MPLIEVDRLQKRFRARPPGKGGLFAALRSLASRERHEVVAVEGVSFQIERGEMVALIGPNGAGKSTTIKMLTGILVPSGGSALVDGLTPWRDRTALASRIGVVFGQRTQLWWDLPLAESFDLLRHMYRVPAERHARSLGRLTELLELGPLLARPVRLLSLGQRMRGDLAAALLHEPPLVYLDEPTIGLDVVAKERVRGFLLELNRGAGTTVLLTTHDMDDVARLCERTLLIDRGKLLYDGGVAELVGRMGGERRLVVDLDEDVASPEVPGARLERREGRRIWLSFSGDEVRAPELIGRVSALYRVRDLRLEEPDVEAVVRRIYEEGLP
jgi:ABC-2 type transport system ATP-binding protein